MEPGSHGEEGEVHGGSRGKEGGAGDEHPGTEHEKGEAEPTYIGPELAENTAIEINLE